MSLVRAFIAVEIFPNLKEKLYKETESLRGALPHSIVRWVHVKGMHLTLKFLGDTPISKLEELKGYLVEETARQKPFEIAVGGIGVFGGFSRPRVIWVGVQDNGGLASLQRCVETAARRMGSDPERRPFSPHLTLGRVQQRISRSERARIREMVLAHEKLDFGKMQVNSLHLFESQLKPSGAVYRSLYSTKLDS